MNGTTEDPLWRKKNLKWYRSRIESFGDDVTHHAKVLKTAKCNIRDQHRLNNFPAIRQERMVAERAIRSLRQLQIDVDQLRDQVVDSDVAAFDKLVNPSRQRLVTAIDSFTKYCDSLSLNDGPARRTKMNGYGPSTVAAYDEPGQQKQILMYALEDPYQRELVAQVEKVEQDSRDINEMFHSLSTFVHDQKEKIDSIESQVEETHVHVVSAQREIAQVASRMRGSVYPVVGAIVGTCVGGPIGLVAGLKVGTAFALTGSVIGFSSGKVLKMRQQRLQREIEASAQSDNKNVVKTGKVLKLRQKKLQKEILNSDQNVVKLRSFGLLVRAFGLKMRQQKPY